jgi:hypothetical protein
MFFNMKKITVGGDPVCHGQLNELKNNPDNY